MSIHHQTDLMRFIDSIGLTNEQIKAKINEQLQREKAAREIQERLKPKWMKSLDWDGLLKTKLFNNPKA
jgi:hypothetical protein